MSSVLYACFINDTFLLFRLLLDWDTVFRNSAFCHKILTYCPFTGLFHSLYISALRLLLIGTLNCAFYHMILTYWH
jgi:hypothetical protein